MSGKRMQKGWHNFMKQLRSKATDRKEIYEEIAKWFPHNILLKRYHHVRRLEVVLDFIERVGNNLLVLDIGCGDGIQAKKVGMLNSVIGIDISFTRLKRAQKRVKNANFVCGDLYHLPFKRGTFDISLFLEVIEHLKNPEIALREIYQVLKKERYVILSTPCKTNLVDIAFRFLAIESRWGLDIDKSHVFFYDFASIRKVLTNAQFRLVNYRGGPCLRWDLRLLNKTVFRKHKVYRLCDRLLSLLPFISKYGANEIVLAKRCI